jgi:2-dehydropantoate 2-reductase
MRVLVIGAGAVGQVYGRHLALGGAHVSYYVRERHAAECRRGFVFYPLDRKKPRAPVRVEIAATDVLTTLDEVRAVAWDQVYLCVASHALRGAWLGELAAAVGDATIVALQPGSEDRDVILESVPASRLVSSMIVMLGYAAPLPGESLPEPGTAYWFPPLVPAPVSGPAERARAVVDTLRRGGLPAKLVRDVPARVRFPSGLFMPLLTALEASGWSFRELASSEHIRRVRPAAIEAFAIVARAHDARPPRVLRMLARPFWLRRGLTLARWFVPFDVETFYRVHFTKVRDQTRMYMRGYIDRGAELGLPTNVLAELERSVAPAAPTATAAAPPLP